MAMGSTFKNSKKGTSVKTHQHQKHLMLGFELESMRPTHRFVLDLDPRIFPKGILPDSIVEIRGPCGSGKTFLMTYLLARFLTIYPEKTAILIDTNFHFNYINLKSILSHLDPEIHKSDEKFRLYVNRISHIKCFDAPDLLSALGTESPIDTMLLTEPNLSLIIIDSIDSYSWTPEIAPNENFPNILKLLKMSVEKTRTPVLCSLTDYFPFPQQQPANKSSSTATTTTSALSSISTLENQNLYNRQPNIILDSNFFTMTMVLSPHSILPVFNMEQHQQQTTSASTSTSSKSYTNLNDPNPTSNLSTIYECTAHLRSRHNPNTAPFSALNHRVKFSIFSGMLHINC